MPMSGRSIRCDGAAKGFYFNPGKVDRLLLKHGSSMTTRTFNMLWCDALNARADHPITHFAMIHDDVCPGDEWLDAMLEELEASGADMISAVIPIKDNHGLTSTAVDTGDPWLVRRLCLNEVFSMPVTFSVRDVPWAETDDYLLPNTGLFVCRFDQPWVEKIAFKFQNRIVRMPDGSFASQDIPEDWDMGRQLHALDRKVVCTRKVRLEHEHPQFHNKMAWGEWPTDLAYLDFLRLHSGGAEGWTFPDDVDGWLTATEGAALARLATDKSVLEIGSYCGRSTIAMAQTAKLLHAVDPFDARATSTPRHDTLVVFLENITRYGVLQKVVTHQGTAAMMVPHLAERFDLAFIDGAHDQDSVLRDARLATAKLNEGGLLAFHDYGPTDPGVVLAVEELVAGGAKILERQGSIAVVRPALAA